MQQYRFAVAMIRPWQKHNLQPIARIHITGNFCIIPRLYQSGRGRNSKHTHTCNLRSTQVWKQQLRRDTMEQLKGDTTTATGDKQQLEIQQQLEILKTTQDS
jgi:hypothetical protein